MRKIWQSVYRWGDVQKSVDATIESHIHHFKHLLNIPKNFERREFNQNAEQVVQLAKKSRFSKKILRDLMKLCGSENVVFDDFTRARHSTGKYYGDLLRLRMGKVEHPPDAVLYPRTENEIQKIIAYCTAQKIAVIPFGGGTSVTRALEAEKGGIALDLSVNFKDVLSLNADNSTVTVESGILGPALESYLNERGYTCGHFPQSFEFATVGGWIAARGAGQASTGYGRIEDLLIGLRAVTPAGLIECGNYPAASIGPDMREVFLGSEGAFGVITHVTLRIRKYNAKHSILKSYMFKTFEKAIEAQKVMMQSQVNPPHFFRISDPEETEAGLGMKGKDKGLTGMMLNLLGYKAGGRTLMYAIFEGDRAQARLSSAKLAKIAKKRGAISLGSYATRKWLEQRYSSAYMRDPMMSAGIRIDTIETACSYERAIELWQSVRSYIKADHETLCLTHVSHAYETGINLYFIFARPMLEKNELEQFEKFHKGLYETFLEHGGTLSHHHGIGRLLAAGLPRQHSAVTLKAFKALKMQLDPRGIMNPGVLGL